MSSKGKRYADNLIKIAIDSETPARADKRDLPMMGKKDSLPLTNIEQRQALNQFAAKTTKNSNSKWLDDLPWQRSI